MDEIDLNLVGYIECMGLDRVFSKGGPYIFLKSVTVIFINDKYSYMACVKCFKKV